jgi:hypothetical protein
MRDERSAAWRGFFTDVEWPEWPPLAIRPYGNPTISLYDFTSIRSY